MNLAISTSLYPLRMFGSKFPEKRSEMRQQKSPESFLSMFIVRNKIITRNIFQVKLYCVSPPYNWSGPLLFKGKVSWGFWYLLLKMMK